MSAADEDTELRDLLVQTLDKNGVLGKIKAELRSCIFLALEAQEQSKTQNPLRNTVLQKFAATDDGRTCIGLVNEFLDHFNLDYTSAVFGPEASINDMIPTGEQLRQRLNIEKSSDHAPLLANVLQSSKTDKPTQEGLGSHQVQFLRLKFDSFDHDGSGSIDRKDVSAVLGLACPFFHPDMLESFVANEMKNRYSSSVTFEVFMAMFNKLYEMCQSVTGVGNQHPSPQIPSKQITVKSPEKPLPPDSYFVKQSQTFHQVPSSPTPMSEETPPKMTTEGIPTSYLMPTGAPPQEGSMDVSYDDFFDSQPGRKNVPDLGAAARARTADSGYSELPASRMTTSHEAQPVESADSSVTASSEWPNKKAKTDYGSGLQQYEDDFNSEQSISEEIQDLSNMGDDLLQSSDKEGSLDLTEDRTVSEIPHADYMEDVRHG